MKSKVMVRRSDHGRARPGSVRYRRTVRTSCRERAGDAPATAASLGSQHQTTMSAEKMNKKTTNEANMLLKTKDRVYKRSQTNPMESGGKPSRPVVGPTLQTGPIWRPPKALVVPHFDVAPPFKAAPAGLKPGTTKLECVTTKAFDFLTMTPHIE